MIKCRRPRIVAMLFVVLALIVPAGMVGAQDEDVSDGQPNAQMQAVLDAVGSLNTPRSRPCLHINARNLPDIPYSVDAAAANQGMGVIPEPVGKIDHVLIPREGGEILARVYTPAGDGPFPVVVYYHGGGWVLFNLNSYDAAARAPTISANAIVVSVAYRQAPENPFPGPLDDAYTSYKWVVKNAASINGDASRVAAAGESAGGNLATVVAMKVRDEGYQRPVHQLLVLPVTNYAFDTRSYEVYADAKPLSRPLMMWFWDHYLANEEDGNSPYASPLRADDLSGMPPTTVILAEIDPLQSEGRAYAERLSAAGVPTTVTLYEGVTHEFFGMGAVVNEARDAVATAEAGLRSSFSDDGVGKGDNGDGKGIDTMYFPETGQSLSGAFMAYWNANGGLPVFGYPLTGQMDVDGRTVQHLERQRFEWHPENAGTPYEVQLGRLGADILMHQGTDWQSFDKADSSSDHYFMETGQAIAREFWAHWSSHGLEMGESIALFSYPISPMMEQTGAVGSTMWVQWFERARFEYHPNNAAPYQVLLGRLGAEMMENQ